MQRRTAIVTGASTGIGLAVSSELCRQGFAVTMAARKPERLDAAAAALRADGHDVTPIAIDVTDPDSSEQLVESAIGDGGRLDVVVANAGWGRQGTVATSRHREFDRMMAVNVGAPFALAAAAIPHMRRDIAATPPAWFIVTASISGVWPTAGLAGYSAAKAAALSLARSIADDEASNGVRACAICPAFVDTDMTTWVNERLPGDEMLGAADVAESVRFLLRLSPYASVTELVLRRAGAPSPDAP